jgi:hypothetical protein
VTAARASARATSQRQEDQEQSDNQTEQTDSEPRRAARHEAPLDQAGTLTDPDTADEDGESTDDQADRAPGSGPHLEFIPIG